MTHVPHHPDQPQQKQGLSGCAVVAIVLGVLGVVAIIGIVVLGALLLPAVSRARENAMQIMSGSNMRQVTLGLEQYRVANGAYPDADDWQNELLTNMLVTPDLFEHPNVDGTQQVYFFVPQPARSDGASAMSRAIILYEHPDAFERGGNIAYSDTSVEWVEEPRFSELINALTLPDGTPYAPHTAVTLPQE